MNIKHKSAHNLTAGESIHYGRNVLTVKSVSVVPGLRKQVVVIETNEGETVRVPMLTIIRTAN